MTRRLRRCLLVRRKGLELRIATREKPRNRTRNVWTGKNWGEDLEGSMEKWRWASSRDTPQSETTHADGECQHDCQQDGERQHSDQPFLLTDTNTETKRMWGNYPPWQYFRGLCIQPELHKDVLGSPNWDQERWIRQDWILCSQIGG